MSHIQLMDVAKRTWAGIREDDVFGRAAQLAYYFFLAMFPFLIFVIASLSVFGSADRGRALLFGIFARFLPGAAFQLISQTFNQIIQSSGPLKMSFGIGGSIWSASMGMSAMMDTLNAAYNVKETRSVVKQYGGAIALTVGLAALLIISVLAAIWVNALTENWGVLALLWRIAEWPAGIALLLFAFAVTYYFAPDLKHRQWHWITPGAVAGVVLLAIVSAALRVYLHFAGNYNTTYGPLGAVIVLLLVFYAGGIAVLFGGVLNGVLENGNA